MDLLPETALAYCGSFKYGKILYASPFSIGVIPFFLDGLSCCRRVSIEGSGGGVGGWSVAESSNQHLAYSAAEVVKEYVAYCNFTGEVVYCNFAGVAVYCNID